MKNAPILFSTLMLKAILEGRKTQTRRIVKIPPYFEKVYGVGFSAFTPEGMASVRGIGPMPFYNETFIKIPYGEPGSRLWVRETWARVCADPSGQCDGWGCRFCTIEYKADSKSKYPGGWPDEYPAQDVPCKWRPSIHMPRIASRINLEIQSIRVERLQDITEEDAIAEGVYPDMYTDHPKGLYYTAFQSLWEQINSKESWDSNPWVWVIGFDKI